MMDGTRYLRINSRKCEQHLSSFGKKILHELIKQWHKEQEEPITHNRRHHYSPTKKVLNFHKDCFRETAAPQTPVTLPPPIEIYNTEVPMNFDVIENTIPEIPTSEELTKAIDMPRYDTNDFFIHPTIRSKNVVLNALDYNDKLDIESFKTVETDEGIGAIDVNWDNMFDSELLEDVTREVDNKVIEKEPNSPNAINLKQISKKATKLDSNKELNENSVKKRKATITSTITTNKAKQKTNHLIEPIKNSNNNASVIPKINFRKQKYTKTVKKWLNDVELHKPNILNDDTDVENVENALNDEEINKADTNKYDSITSGLVNNNKPKITIDRSIKDKKKVVQAQLANKDGIMKYSKPKSATEESKQETFDVKVVKYKKTQGTKKFVPPIKSQIPVKDITYEIVDVDDTNGNECINAINSVDDSELIAVLIYSNGFCQLNGHNTDDTCVAEGLIIGAGDVFYCFKGHSQNHKKALTSIFDNNIVISYDTHNVLMYLVTNIKIDIYKIKTYDVKIGASLLDPDNPPENFSDLQKQLSFTAPYTVATECPKQKASWYMTLLKECWSKLREALVDNQLWHVFVDIEMKLIPIIAEMECRGVSIDVLKLKSLESVLMSRMQHIEQLCYKSAGKVFQINSTVQVRGILYDELKLDTKCHVKIRETLAGGLKSTSEPMLRSLMSVHELPKLILEYRHLHKAHATFLAGIAQHVEQDVVRPNWSQMAAATGRIASSNPNLQAIPKVPFNLVMFPDQDDCANTELKFRNVYVSREGYILLAADFKHIECRVFAHLAADSSLATALAHDDLFTVLAALWLNKPEDAISSSERERTKRLVYASLYGAGTRKLMEILDVSYEQALQVAASFNRTFPSLKSFGREVVSRCSESGARLSTLCGRVRHFANISSNDFNLRSHAERQAVNFVIQGSAADLCKRAMILTEDQLRSHCPPVEAHLLLQIHDELVWEVKRDHLPIAAGIIKRVMEGCGEQCGMSTPLPVALTVGDNWADMAQYHIN